MYVCMYVAGKLAIGWTDLDAVFCNIVRFVAEMVRNFLKKFYSNPVASYVDYSQFLTGGGLDIEIQDMMELPTKQQMKLSAQVKLLTLPGEMGEYFKCLGVSRGSITRPSAFRIKDRTHTL